jgi:hypothetical protein
MGFIWLLLLLNRFPYINPQLVSETTSTIQTLISTTTLSPWDQAYKEVFGYLPTEFQYSNSTETITTHPIVIENGSPNLTYEFKNGSVQILGNLTNTDKLSTLKPSQPVTLPKRICRDKSIDCGKMLHMCTDKLYEAFLADMCQLSCQKCGVCLDQSKR